MTAVRPAPLPSKAQLALATAVVRSKPEGITVREYILQLRRSTEAGRKPAVDAMQHHHFNGIKYWRDQYERAGRRCHKLQNEVYQLERAKDALQNQIDNMDIGIHPTADSSKRKRTPGKQQKRPAKRLQVSGRNSGHGHCRTAPDLADDDSDDVQILGEAGTQLALNLYRNHKLCNADVLVLEDVCSNLVKVARAMAAAISQACEHFHHQAHRTAAGVSKSSTALDNDKWDLGNVTRVLARAFSSILYGLDKVAAEESSNKFCSLIVYETVAMFSSALASLSNSACFMAGLETSLNSLAIKGQNKPPNIADPASSFSKLLSAFITQLNKSDAHHRELFEGFLFMLLESTGKRLYYCTFGRNRNATIQGDIAGPRDQDSPAVIERKKIQDLGVRLEVQATLPILCRAMAVAPLFLNQRSAATAAKTSKPNLTRSFTLRPTLSTRTPLSEQAKERLQRTLIHCMFGSEKQDEFSDVLRMPAKLPALPSMPKAKAEVEDWFAEQVWALVGWDLLGKDSAW